MNAQAILNQIEADARDTAQKTLADAQTKADEMRTTSREKIEGMHKALLSQAQTEGDALEQRMLRMAELEERKELLAKKTRADGEAFEMAGKKLSAASNTDKRVFFLRQLLAFATGGETLEIGGENAGWFDDHFLSDANAALLKAGKTERLTLAPEKRPGYEGFLLIAGGAEMRCTFDALLEEARTELERQAAEDLFGTL